MRSALPFQVAPIKLVQTLKRDDATFFGAESVGDFLPRFALLALRADEINERLNAAAICSPAAVLRLISIFGFQIHRR